VTVSGGSSSICFFLMKRKLRVWDTNDLAPNQMFKIYIRVSRNKSRRANIAFICDSVKGIPRPDSIPARVFPTTVHWHVDTISRL